MTNAPTVHLDLIVPVLVDTAWRAWALDSGQSVNTLIAQLVSAADIEAIQPQAFGSGPRGTRGRRITYDLTLDVHARLQRAARRRGVPVTRLVRTIVHRAFLAAHQSEGARPC